MSDFNDQYERIMRTRYMLGPNGEPLRIETDNQNDSSAYLKADELAAIHQALQLHGTTW